jgi:putative radical SAM enzyme (TIGR03279 family)
MIEILSIEPGSIAEKLKIASGSKLISINDNLINDALDYRFQSSGEELEILIEMAGEQIIYEIEKEYQEDIGLILEDLKMRKCGNKCVFCFVHQNPKGLRKSLYFKDEDYRFSFLYGHYVTLSNAKHHDLKRIVEQRLTPLYVSVHVTDSDLRKYMLGIKYDDHLMEKFDYLTQNGIELNCQIVLCPELNDGEYLNQTISDLKSFYPAVKSIAIVPVGLTKFRKNLPELLPVTHEYSLKLMDRINIKREMLKSEIGSSFVYLSDEFYINNGVELPDHDYYEGFYQLENGVGLTRDLLQRLLEELPDLLKNDMDLKLTLVSGKLGAKALEKYFLQHLIKIPRLKLTLYTTINYFFGESIVVSGLLVGEDLFHQLKRKELGDYVILPPKVLNHDGLFLDDWTVERLEGKLKKKIIIFPGSFLKLFEKIEADKEAKTMEESKQIRHAAPSLYIAEHMKRREDFYNIDPSRY